MLSPTTSAPSFHGLAQRSRFCSLVCAFDGVKIVKFNMFLINMLLGHMRVDKWAVGGICHFEETIK